MSPDLLLILLAGIPAGLAWERWHRHLTAIAAKKANCYHEWKQPVNIFSHHWVRHCGKCGAQCNGWSDDKGEIHWGERVV